MNKTRVNNEVYIDISKPLSKKTKKLLRNAKPAKKHFCYNLFNKKISIGLWEIPDTKYKNYPKLSFANFKSYAKIGISWKNNLFEIVWNKKTRTY
jgi:hypothetical protein